ncbi:MAG: alpha/beta fold hydrolase [Burkholderiaceae bacterium]|nr:MAG: alpha/beta fold hydrolase [Burkholderiaceae bacterium]TBR75226.1 MAG: alpha/beta fold hydrolase [Burkholderiaceae bacterium]
MAAIPVVFGPVDAWCFGWLHPASAPRRGEGIVLCRPIGYEANCTYEIYTQLAERLAHAGFDVLRFDYHGTGDSAGGDADTGRVRAWIDSIRFAIQKLKQLTGVSSISLFGVRMGATLAAHAASGLGDVESLVMWAPCLTGRAFSRELRAASVSRKGQESNLAPDDIEAFGYLYTVETLEGLSTLDCQRLAAPPAKRVMVIGRDDMPSGEDPLPSRYREMGVDAAFEAWPGYAGMMRDPHEAMVERATLDHIVDWYCTAMAPAGDAPPAAPLQRPPATAHAVSSAVREIPLTFGPGQSLFGILTEPVGNATDDRRSEAVMLMLNVGGHCHIGPGRLYVNMARSWAASGYRTLRLDVTGIGDSRTRACLSACDLTSLYSIDHTADVRAAIDCLAARGFGNFTVMGICSGSAIAFQAAWADTRVTRQILLNSLRLEGKPEEENTGGDKLVGASIEYKPTYFYHRALRTPTVYLRVLRGQVNVRGIAGYFLMLMATRLWRAIHQLVQATPDKNSLLIKFKRLATRGTDTLVLVGHQDHARTFIEFHLGKMGRRMRKFPNFRMAVMENADHTLSSQENQNTAIKIICEHLNSQMSADAVARCRRQDKPT